MINMNVFIYYVLTYIKDNVGVCKTDNYVNASMV